MRIYASRSQDAAMVRPDTGSDLLEALTEAVRRLGFEAGTVQVIGALSRLRLGYYDQEERTYRNLDFEGHWELASGIGNVSMRDGEPFVHVHLVCSAPDGAAVGGHLIEGCEVFVAEAYLRALGGEPPVRSPDETTGLALWQ